MEFLHQELIINIKIVMDHLEIELFEFYVYCKRDSMKCMEQNECFFTCDDRVNIECVNRNVLLLITVDSIFIHQFHDLVIGGVSVSGSSVGCSVE